MLKINLLLLFSMLSFHLLSAQEYRWQQRVEYSMDVMLDVKSHKLVGNQKLVYFNNSPDTLTKVFYHLYFNAFQPNSMMDVRSRTIADPDSRVRDRISKLKDNEIGYQRVNSLKQDGKNVSWRVDGTILEVTLPKPILPKAKTIFEMQFEAQIPVQIRRSGRNNSEGIAYSMTQWYPKMAEYDFQGWHAYPYVGREFHSVWGDYNVKITLPSNFIVAGTGLLQNAEKIGYNYAKEEANTKRSGNELTWNFVAKDVHDFAWAADPDYTHITAQVPDGPLLRFFYQKNEQTKHWEQLPALAVSFFQFMNKNVGKYPYPSYSVIQGGDGGMEYPMCTLITGEGDFSGTAQTMIHEMAHAWFQGVLGSNEALYPWMDEGFTRFVEYESLRTILDVNNPHEGSYNAYIKFALSEKEEPASLHGDFFKLNNAYKISSYIKGAIMLSQLEYIIGKENLWRGLRNYYSAWKFKHPEPIDFIRVMEKVSDIQLKWYLNLWIHTTWQIDYAIQQVVEKDNETYITLERQGDLPMPIDLVITYKNGTKEMYYIPMSEMLGNKPVEQKDMQRIDLDAWPWVNPTYTLKVSHDPSDIEQIEIDPSQRMADVDRSDNTLDISDESSRGKNR